MATDHSPQQVTGDNRLSRTLLRYRVDHNCATVASWNPPCGFVRVDLRTQGIIMFFSRLLFILPLLTLSSGVWYQSDYHKQKNGENGGTDQHNRIWMRKHVPIMPRIRA